MISSRWWGVQVALVAVLGAGAACDRSTRSESSTAPESRPTPVESTAGAAKPAAAPRPPDAQGARAMEPTLEWKIDAENGHLRVHYEVMNPGPTPLWVVDDLLTWQQTAFGRAPKAVIVRNSDRPGTVSFYRGMMDIPSREMRQYPTPGVREVAPGAQLSGEAETALPLTAWHNYHPKKIEPLAGTPTHAILEVQILRERGTPDDWREIKLVDGSTLEVPNLRFLNAHSTLLRSGALALP